MSPFFSIITVCFNAQHVIERTIKSVKSQCYREFEHIIIDGVSTDETMKTLQRYRQEVSDYEVNVISEPDKGIYDAMNKGLRLAKGNYVVFLNAGDKLHNKMVLHNIKLLIGQSTQDVGVIYGNTVIVNDDGDVLGNRHLTPPEHLSWRSFKRGMLVCHQSFYVRRDICQEYDLRYRYSADVDWCIKVMKKAETKQLALVYDKEILTDYLSEGETTRHHRLSLMERFSVMRRHYGLFITLMMHLSFVIRSIRR